MVTVELLERVKAATGPDRELDARLWCMDEGYDFLALATGQETYGQFATSLDDHVVNPHSRVMPGHLVFQKRGEVDPRRGNRTQMMGSFTAYTASIDAALALTERVLPGHMGGFEPGLGGICHGKVIAVSKQMTQLVARATAPTAPLAILAATLSALIVKEPS